MPSSLDLSQEQLIGYVIFAQKACGYLGFSMKLSVKIYGGAAECRNNTANTLKHQERYKTDSNSHLFQRGYKQHHDAERRAGT